MAISLSASLPVSMVSLLIGVQRVCVNLVSLPGHHRSGFDMVEGDFALQQLGVLQQRNVF